MADSATKAPPDTLNLSVLVSGVPIRIDGKDYEILLPDCLPLIAYKRLQTDLPRLGHLILKATLTDDEATEMAAMLMRVVEQVLTAPSDVRAKLSDVQRLQVMNVFMQLRSDLTTPDTATKATTSRRTGRTSSRR